MAILGRERERYPDFELTSPASRGQLVWMIAATAVGAVAGLIVLSIAVSAGHIGGEVWLLFGLCEGLAFITGAIALVAQRERAAFLVRAVRLAMDLERRSVDLLRLPKPRYLPFVAEEFLPQAIRYRDALIGSGDLDIAFRLQNAVIRLQEVS
jgi:hypothetical protein